MVFVCVCNQQQQQKMESISFLLLWTTWLKFYIWGMLYWLSSYLGPESVSDFPSNLVDLLMN
jgi:hypothetical protein